MFSSEFGKKIKRAAIAVDQNLGRSERSEVLTVDLLSMEKQLEQIRTAYCNTVKRLQSCLPGPAGDPEKKLKRLPESSLSQTLNESASALTNRTLLGKIFGACGVTQQLLATSLVHYAVQVEDNVLQPIITVVEKDIPLIMKLRRQLTVTTRDMDAAKKVLSTLSEKKAQVPIGKLEAANEEVKEAEVKVEQCKDQLVVEMYSFFAREEKLCKLLLSIVEVQREHHRQSLECLDHQIARMNEEIEHFALKPVFGTDLKEHLENTKQEIATVVEVSVQLMLSLGLNEEGIFRIAPSATKLNKLKAAFDANITDIENDVHCLAGALKLYLRSLPEPLMTFGLFDEWLKAAKRPTSERLNAIKTVLNHLPKHNYENLRYLIKFMAQVAEHSDLNKMSASNLAIVMAPNLLWPSTEDRGSVQFTGIVAGIVDALVSNSEWFFPDDQPGPTGRSLTPVPDPSLEKTPENKTASSISVDVNQNSKASVASSSSSSLLSSDDHHPPRRPVHRQNLTFNAKKPPAPVAPIPRPVNHSEFDESDDSPSTSTSASVDLTCRPPDKPRPSIRRCKTDSLPRPSKPPPPTPPALSPDAEKEKKLEMLVETTTSGDKDRESDDEETEETDGNVAGVEEEKRALCSTKSLPERDVKDPETAETHKRLVRSAAVDEAGSAGSTLDAGGGCEASKSGAIPTDKATTSLDDSNFISLEDADAEYCEIERLGCTSAASSSGYREDLSEEDGGTKASFDASFPTEDEKSASTPDVFSPVEMSRNFSSRDDGGRTSGYDDGGRTSGYDDDVTTAIVAVTKPVVIVTTPVIILTTPVITVTTPVVTTMTPSVTVATLGVTLPPVSERNRSKKSAEKAPKSDLETNYASDAKNRSATTAAKPTRPALPTKFPKQGSESSVGDDEPLPPVAARRRPVAGYDSRSATLPVGFSASKPGQWRSEESGADVAEWVKTSENFTERIQKKSAKPLPPLPPQKSNRPDDRHTTASSTDTHL